MILCRQEWILFHDHLCSDPIQRFLVGARYQSASAANLLPQLVSPSLAIKISFVMRVWHGRPSIYVWYISQQFLFTPRIFVSHSEFKLPFLLISWNWIHFNRALLQSYWTILFILAKRRTCLACHNVYAILEYMHFQTLSVRFTYVTRFDVHLLQTEINEYRYET
jgi:hypothetical protein